MEYSHKLIEKKWQKFWEDKKTFVTTDNHKNKAYVLDMFPYPSGKGLHVGHPKGYTATDAFARFKRMNNFDVLHPIGWDAFGLPAEQYAIKTGNDPEEFTLKNIDNFRIQLKSLGFSFDYSREINTSKQSYYKITQFIFKKLYENNLAELKQIDVNWCEELKTVLSNEEVVVKNGKMVSERGNFSVIKKSMSQWVLKITNYADKLLEGLDALEWPVSVKNLQKNWIGKSKGLEIIFSIKDSKEKIKIFTTRADTISGITYIAISPEHPLLSKIVTKSKINIIDDFLELVKTKTDLEREDNSKEKNGIFTGTFAINPLNNEKIPIWVADYVLPHYATGIVMGVPGHDERDYKFAKKYKLPIKYIISPVDNEKVVLHDGKHINSLILDGLFIKEAKQKLINIFSDKKIITNKEYFKLRNWLFSRQRYWGEPFPIINWEDGSISLLDDKELPLVLPKTKNIIPSKDGQSPLINCKKWVNVVSSTGLKGKRETNTMPQWAGSCWYYIGYILAKNGSDNLLDINSKEAKIELKKWLPVDLYVGGQEHAVLHLLYARFWHKFLFDIKLVPTKEPFQRLINQGMILGPDGTKMSKSKGNVINPDDIIKSHGADALRLYEMFMGPLTSSLSWSMDGVDSSRKWLDRIYRFFKSITVVEENDKKMDYIYNSVVRDVTDRIEKLEFNIAISKLMTLLNHFYKETKIYKNYLEGFVKMINPFIPHLAEELWHNLGYNNSITYEKWPEYNPTHEKKQRTILIVQVNGKLKGKINITDNITKDDLISLAMNIKNVKVILANKKIIKTIFIPNKIINFVIK